MKGTIGFEHCRVVCCIGVEQSERQVPQELYIDLKVQYDFSSCMHSDDIQDAINYVDLADVCLQTASNKQYRLMETLASDILNTLLADHRIDWAWIKIKKPQAIPTAQYATVELERKA